MTPLYHPASRGVAYFGVRLSALHGLNIQKDQTEFFANGARPSGLLSLPTFLPDEKARAFEEQWANRRKRDGGLGGTAV